MDSDEEGVFLDESDIIDEIIVDDRDLPDIDDDDDDDSVSSIDELEADDRGMWLVEVDDSVHVFQGHKKFETIYAVACIPTDATLVATGGRDDRAFYWRIGQRDWSKELIGHNETVSSLAFSFDGYSWLPEDLMLLLRYGICQAISSAPM